MVKLLKTSKKHFGYFRKRFGYWHKTFAPEFEVEYDLEFLDGRIAEVHINKNGGVATVKLSDRLHPDYLTNESLDKTAFHEGCHLLLGRLSHEARCFLSASYIDEIEHEIIRKLENCFLGRGIDEAD